MSDASPTLTPSEFFETLERDTFDATTSVTLVGMAKKSDGEQKAIQFAAGQDCTNWTTIPLKAIASVEVIRTVACKDHSHPLVKLNMRAPDSPDGELFSSIISAMQPPSSAGMPAGLGALRPGPGGPLPPRSSHGGVLPRPVSWPERGCHVVCGPAVCPNPSGRGTIWCTDCWIECDPGAPEFSLQAYGSYGY
jgi:hypothetical protein